MGRDRDYVPEEVSRARGWYKVKTKYGIGGEWRQRAEVALRVHRQGLGEGGERYEGFDIIEGDRRSGE